MISAPPNPQTWLAKFSIELGSASTQLYANGRQQVELKLKVQVTSQNDQLSATELASLCIVERDNNGVFRPLSAIEVRGGWWFSVMRNEYDFYAPGVATDTITPIRSTAEAGWAQRLLTRFKKLLTAEQAPPLLTKQLYVMTEAPGSSQKELLAQITRDTGDVYNTDFIFVSSVVLTAVRSEEFSATEDYLLEKNLISGTEDSGIFVYEYLLHPRGVRFLSGRMNPGGMIQWDEKTVDTRHASHVGHAGPGESDFKYDDQIAVGSQFDKVSYVTAVSPGKITIVLQSDINIPYDHNSALYHNGPCRIDAIDSNGNAHALQIKFMGPTGFPSRVNLTLLDG
jgi:hypothetical protein